MLSSCKTNHEQHFILKTKTLKREDLQDFIDCYRPDDRVETKRFKYFDYNALVARDKANLDIFWLKGHSLDDLNDLPPPDAWGLRIGSAGGRIYEI